MLRIDEDAYCAFVVARRAALRRTAYLLTGDWHLAEDLVQMVLASSTSLGRACSDVTRSSRTPGAQLVNAYVDELRRPWRREHGVEAVPELPASTSNAFDSVVRDRLISALASMPPRPRAVLVLRFWEDQSGGADRARVELQHRNRESQTTRGLERLRTLLGPEKKLAAMEAR